MPYLNLKLYMGIDRTRAIKTTLGRTKEACLRVEKVVLERAI